MRILHITGFPWREIYYLYKFSYYYTLTDQDLKGKNLTIEYVNGFLLLTRLSNFQRYTDGSEYRHGISA